MLVSVVRFMAVSFVVSENPVSFVVLWVVLRARNGYLKRHIKVHLAREVLCFVGENEDKYSCLMRTKIFCWIQINEIEITVFENTSGIRMNFKFTLYTRNMFFKNFILIFIEFIFNCISKNSLSIKLTELVHKHNFPEWNWIGLNKKYYTGFSFVRMLIFFEQFLC